MNKKFSMVGSKEEVEEMPKKAISFKLLATEPLPYALP